MERLKKLVRDKNKLLAIGGIMHARKAFIGPEVLHIDLTNWCNFNCIACWCRSPLLKEKSMPEWEKKLILPLELIQQVFDDLTGIKGLRQVKLVGGGEPFMHPDILKIIEYIKNKDKDIEIDINTNFSLVDKKIAERLLELNVDSFTVSLWAGTPGYYCLVHPNQNEQTFYKIVEALKFISEQKKKLKRPHPRIIVHNVIFNQNYKDIEDMLRLALDIGVDSIQFVPIDPVKEKTEILLLNGKERTELIEKALSIKKGFNSESQIYTAPDGSTVLLSDFDGFINRLKKLDTTSGAYDEEVVQEVPCYVGWLFARIMATGDVVPCCKGHRMPMGNIYRNRFKQIWFSPEYNEFRFNGLNLPKTDIYFSKIGNDAKAKTGCYNCDNLWQNIPTDKMIAGIKNKGCRV